MAATNAQKISRGRLPSKRSINLVDVGTKASINPAVAVPAIILIVAAAALLSKFFVVDRLAAMTRARSDVAQVQAQLDDGYAKIDSFGDLVDEYAHYTFADMTDEELARADRVAVVDLVQKNIVPGAAVETWSLSGNEVRLSVVAGSLQEINQIARQMNASDLVNFCTVTTAEKELAVTQSAGKSDGDSVKTTTSPVVKATIYVYLNDANGEGNQE